MTGESKQWRPARHSVLRCSPCRYQYHSAKRAAQFEHWLIGHAAELTAAGLSVPDLRRDSATHGATLEAQGRRCLADWLIGIGL
jgi:hypothetical protein